MQKCNSEAFLLANPPSEFKEGILDEIKGRIHWFPFERLHYQEKFNINDFRKEFTILKFQVVSGKKNLIGNWMGTRPQEWNLRGYCFQAIHNIFCPNISFNSHFGKEIDRL